MNTLANKRNKKCIFIFILFSFMWIKILFDINKPTKHSTPRNEYGAEGRQRLPHAIIIGVRKAGTRAMLSYLRHHPDIRVAWREVKFFDHWLNYRQGLEWYRSQMPYSLSHQLTVEKTPNYFMVAGVPEAVHRMNSSVKLILVTRDPFDRAVSDYIQFNRSYWAFRMLGLSFEDIAQNNSILGHLFGFVSNSRYIDNLEEWLQYFPKEQILVIDGEKLGTDPYKELHLAESFLGLRHYFKQDMLEINQEKGFVCFRADLTARPSCLGERKGVPHPIVDHELKRKLNQYYKPYNERFFKVIGRRFEWGS